MKKTAKLLIFVLTIAAAAASLAFTAAAGEIAYGAATVAVPTLNIRSGPDTSYDLVNTCEEGDIVVVLEQTNSDWYYINFYGVTGYVNAPYLKDVLTAENFVAVGRLVGDRVYMRSEPSTTANSLGMYSIGTTMDVVGINNGWYKVRYAGNTGYIRSDFMEITDGYRSSTSSSSSSSDSSLGQQMVDYAMGFLGSRYVYGGMSPSGFDCSGFVGYVYKNFGYTLTRSSAGQYANDGVKIDKSELRAGDLLFFSSNGGRSVTHVGLYIGDNEFIHSSTSSTGVIISRLDSTYYLRVWHGAKRVIVD